MMNVCSSVYVSEGNQIHKVTLKPEESKMSESIMKHKWLIILSFFTVTQKIPFFGLLINFDNQILSKLHWITYILKYNLT